MQIVFNLDENDYLTYQLFVASKSEVIRKRRQRTKVMIPIAYAILACYLYVTDNFAMAIIFFVVGVAWYFFHPLWERRRYLRFYKSQIKENYKERLGRTSTLEINKDFLTVQEKGSESKISTGEIEEINEIPTHILIKLITGPSFILPKSQITDLDQLITELKNIAAYLNIPYIIDENWEWK